MTHRGTTKRKKLTGGRSWFGATGLFLAVFLLGALPVRASVSLLLEQPYGSMGWLNPTGHSALYFDHICAETPTQLRACRPGELGVVISRYHEVAGYDWIAIPLLPYLYAVNRVDEIPTFVDRTRAAELREAWRHEHLQAIAPDLPDGSAPGGNWYELAGSAFDRTLYGFRVRTTAAQDADLIALMNDRSNVERYNGAFRNCADFARVVLNRYYPHAVRRNFVADFGLTTPKAVARGLTHYAHKHPEADLEVFTVPQVAGTLPRSRGVQGVTESLLKRYGLPLILLSPPVAAAVFVAYVGQGRFYVPLDAPALDVRALTVRAETARVFTNVRPVGAGMPTGALPGVETANAAPASDVRAGGEIFPTHFPVPALFVSPQRHEGLSTLQP